MYPVAELRFYGGGQIYQDFDSVFRSPIQVEITVRGKTPEQVNLAMEKVITLWAVGKASYAALRALDVGFYDIQTTDWEIADERQMGSEVHGYVLFDLRIEYTYV